jgi:hypothetical protein
MQNYPVPTNPVYNPEIRALQNSDPASATETFNPLIGRLIENTHAVAQDVLERLRYRGNWTPSPPIGGWLVNDVVTYQEQQFICISNNSGTSHPHTTIGQTRWQALRTSGTASLPHDTIFTRSQHLRAGSTRTQLNLASLQPSHDAGGIRGILKITLPFAGWPSTMLQLKIATFAYQFRGSGFIEVSGYPWAGSLSWFSTSATVFRQVFPSDIKRVRFGFDGTHCCILIGDTDTLWAKAAGHARLVLEQAISHSAELPTEGWRMELIDSMNGITNIAEPTVQQAVLESVNSPVWHDLILQSGVTGLIGETPRFCRIGNIVYTQGVITTPSILPIIPFAILPSGFRPARSICAYSAQNSNAPTIDTGRAFSVSPNGHMSISAGTILSTGQHFINTSFVAAD